MIPSAAYELSFHAIEVHGNAAIVYFTAVVASSTTRHTQQSKTHTWIKDRDAW
jgi:hypothetical protein